MHKRGAYEIPAAWGLKYAPPPPSPKMPSLQKWAARHCALLRRAHNRGPKPNPKSRNAPKIPHSRELFRKVCDLFPVSCDMSQEASRNCSQKKLVEMNLSVLGGFFVVVFPPQTHQCHWSSLLVCALIFRRATLNMQWMGGVPTTTGPKKTSRKCSRYKWGGVSWRCIYCALPQGGHAFTKASRYK